MSDQEVWTSDGVFPSELEHTKSQFNYGELPEQPERVNVDWSKGFSEKFSKEAEKTINALKSPGDAWAGNLSPEQITERGMDLAGVVAMGSSPFVKPGLGMFGGRISSQTVQRAESLEAKGSSDIDIKHLTGLERGAEGKWRMEISDEKARFKEEGFKPIEDESILKGAFLPDVLEHPELYANYPELKNMLVFKGDFKKLHPDEPEKHNFGAMFMSSRDESFPSHIIMNDTPVSSSLSDLLHEVQHAVQRIEGFSGGAIEDLPKEFIDRFKGYMIKKGYSKTTLDDLFTNPTEANKKFAAELAEWADYETYRHLATEVEARNTEARAQLSAQDRRHLLAKATEEYPRSEQIIYNEKTGEGYLGAKPGPHEAAQAEKLAEVERLVQELKDEFSGKPSRRADLRAERADFVDSLVANPNEVIDKVAVRHKHSGDIEAGKGFIHAELMERLIDRYNLKNAPYEHFDSGFLTSGGHFVDREEAYRIANRAKQVKENSYSHNWGELASEDAVGVGRR